MTRYDEFRAWLLRRGVEMLAGRAPADPIGRAGAAVLVIGPERSRTFARLLKEMAACDAYWRKQPAKDPTDIGPLSSLGRALLEFKGRARGTW